MGQRDTESSTAVIQSPKQGQHLSSVHLSHPTAQQAGDKGTVGHPGTVQRSWFTSRRLSKSETALSRARGSLRQKQAGHSAATTSSHQHSLDLELLKKAKLRVEMAIKEKKIFVVQGPYPIIRRQLRARGWVEKKLPSVGRQLEQHRSDQNKLQLEIGTSNGGGGQGKALLSPHGGAEPFQETTDPLHYPEEEEHCDEDPSGIHKLMSYLVRDQPPNFIWTNFLEATDRQLLQQDHVVNHYARVDAFTTKEGLCLSLQNLPWIEQADPNTFFPRCYRLGSVNELEAFIEDFRLTAARSLLKLALEEAGDGPMGTKKVLNFAKGAAQPGSPLYPELVEEALEVCKEHLGVLQHHDIDRRTPSPCRTCINWDRFLQDYYRVAHEGAKLVLTRQQRRQCQNLLQHLAEQLPQLGMEGKLNVWILKPGAESQGRGIICTTRLEEVLQLTRGCTTVQVGRWVVQKYVEKLLTIFGTKFDIRQWFLVTDWKPLTVWFYQDCYLRFCSRPFSLCHLERARHLCNVSVQKWYKSSPDQDPHVPPDKIWSHKQFQEYLAQVGQADAWQQVLVPGMKAAILNALRSAQDQVCFRKGNFELYGADFLVGEDCQPWLLEINSCPSMSPSSAVTRQLCANVQRDTLRLVLDRKDDPTCSIGAFELIYKEAAVPKPLSGHVKLMVKGYSLKRPQSAEHQTQDKHPSASPCAFHHPASPGARATNVHKHQFITTMLSAPKLLVFPGGRAIQVPKQAQFLTGPRVPRLPVSPVRRTIRVPKQAQHPSPTTVPRASKPPVSPGSRTTQVPQRAQHPSPTMSKVSKSPVSPGSTTTQVPLRAQHPSPTNVLRASKPPVSPGSRTTQVPQRAQHRSPTTVSKASKLSVSPGSRTTQVPQRAQHRSPTTVSKASKPPVSPDVPQPRAATVNVPPLEQWSNCSSPSSNSTASPKSRASSAGSQGMPWLSCLPRQPQATHPHISSCPLAWMPVLPPRGTPSNPWLSQGSARSFSPAKSLCQPLSAQSTRTRCLEKHTAAPNGMQKTWDTEIPPGVDPTPQNPAASHPEELSLLCYGTHLLPHSRFKMVL